MASNSHQLRGNYQQAQPDFTVHQDCGLYTAQDQHTWRVLYQRQRAKANTMGCHQFNSALATLEKSMSFDTAIPDLAKVNQLLTPATGWTLVAVPGLIPDREFFKFLAARIFPVTVWIRRPSEIDYIVEPDMFHDFFGHVPMLFDLSTADFLADYGSRAAQANQAELEKLARLYWYTIEFGLVAQSNGIKAFGAGLLSSASELGYAINGTHLHRPFSRDTIRHSDYQIDRFQSRYFVLPNVAALL
jgi:phenylalanine-4-hydroxylase